MKVILVRSDQFQKIWDRLVPAQRDNGSVPHPAIVLRHLDTMLVLNEDFELGTLVPFTEDISLQELNSMIREKKYFEVG